MSRRRRLGPLKTTSYYVTEPGDLHMAKQGGIVSIGVVHRRGEVVTLELDMDILGAVAEFINDCLHPTEAGR